MELNGLRQLLVSLKNTEGLLDTSVVVGLEVNTDEIKYKFMSRHQNAGRGRDKIVANKSLKNVMTFKILVENNTFRDKVVTISSEFVSFYLECKD